MSFSGCRECASYNRGSGTSNCLKCPKYKDVINKFSDLDHLPIVHLPSMIMEQVASSSKPNGLLWAIRKMDPREMAIMLMRFFGECTQLEIAEALGLTDRTVRTEIDKAISSLKIILSEHGISVSVD